MAAPLAAAAQAVMTVRGPVVPSQLGVMLVHEHLFSNFGEEPAEPPVYAREALLAAVVPYAESVKKLGCGAVADGTTAWFGRDPLLLQTISVRSGLHILTNTGLYGAANDRYVPRRVLDQPVRAIAQEWIREAEHGIRETGVRPGFIKIGVDAGPLSEIDAKLVRAGAVAHRSTGLTMTVHTGDNPESAERQLRILAEEGVAPSAWVWIHANQCKDDAAIAQMARRGAWVSLDGLDSQDTGPARRVGAGAEEGRQPATGAVVARREQFPRRRQEPDAGVVDAIHRFAAVAAEKRDWG